MVEKNLLTMAILEGIEKSEGCPLCYLWAKSEERLLTHLLTNEMVMDPDFREKVTAAKGFCNRHMHLLYRTAYSGHSEDGLGFALYMQGAIERILGQIAPLAKDLDGLESTNDKILFRGRKQRKKMSLLSSKIKNVVQGQKPCPACESLWSLDQVHLHTLIQMMDDKDFREEFESSRWLCLPHFLSAIQMVNQNKFKNPVTAARALVRIEIKRLKLVERYLSKFVKKSCWESRKEPVGPEVYANPMVLHLLVGVEGIYQAYKKKVLEETTTNV